MTRREILCYILSLTDEQAGALLRERSADRLRASTPEELDSPGREDEATYIRAHQQRHTPLVPAVPSVPAVPLEL